MKRTEKIVAEYHAELREISEQCEAEGYPGTGSNFDLRTEGLWEDQYEDDYIRAYRLDQRDSFRATSAVFH